MAMEKVKFIKDIEAPNMTITGNLTVKGTSVVSSQETVVTKESIIRLREGATAGLMSDEYTGIVAEKYDGANNGMLVFDSEGTAYVGDEGDVQPLMTRADENAMINKVFLKWNSLTNRAESSILLEGISENSIQLNNCIAGIKGFYWSAIDVETKTITLSTVNGSFGINQDFNIAHYWAIGDTISIVSNQKWDKCSIITALSGNSIVVDKLPFSAPIEESKHFTDQYVVVPEKPDKGLVDFGLYSLAFGENSKAINYNAIAFGRDNEAYGQYAFAAGRDNKAGYACFVLGGENEATGEQSFIIGYKNKSSGANSFVSGRENTASGMRSFASGYQSTASGDHSFAFGQGATASAECSLAIGYNVTASYKYASALGCGTISSGYASFAIGNVTEATGAHSFSNGKFTKAKGESSFAIGQYGVAKGAYSYIEGYGTTESSHEASGNYSHVEGRDNKATASGAHVGGRDSIAAGAYSFAHGYGLNANAEAQMVIGKYNATNSNALFIIGDGTSSNQRKNIFEVLKNGGFQARAENGILEFVSDTSSPSLKILGQNDKLIFEARVDDKGYGTLVTEKLNIQDIDITNSLTSKTISATEKIATKILEARDSSLGIASATELRVETDLQVENNIACENISVSEELTIGSTIITESQLKQLLSILTNNLAEGEY